MVKIIGSDKYEIGATGITCVVDANLPITAYAGKAIVVEGVSFDGGAVSGITTLGASGVVTLSDTTSSTSTTTGALKVAGGVGIVENLNVGGDIKTVPLTAFTQTFNTSGTAPTFSTNKVSYKQVGKLVYVWGTLQNTTGGTQGSGAVDLDFNVPVAMANTLFYADTVTCGNGSSNIAETKQSYYCRAIGGRLRFYGAEAGSSDLTAGTFSNDVRSFYFSAVYEAA